MRRRDWICKTCGLRMYRTSSKLMVCICGNSKARLLWGIMDLSRATRRDYKRFTIEGAVGFWEYVPWAHVDCMEHAPESPAYLVAKMQVNKRGRWMARTFRPAKPPRVKAT